MSARGRALAASGALAALLAIAAARSPAGRQAPAANRPGRTALVDEVLLVKESTLEHSVSLLLQIEKTVVEGAGAAGLAAVLAHRQRFAGKKVGLVLCGGNIDTRLLANVLLQFLHSCWRMATNRL